MGAIDSIIDTVGVVYALHLLGVEKVYCSALPFSEVSVCLRSELCAVYCANIGIFALDGSFVVVQLSRTFPFCVPKK